MAHKSSKSTDSEQKELRGLDSAHIFRSNINLPNNINLKKQEIFLMKSCHQPVLYILGYLLLVEESAGLKMCLTAAFWISCNYLIWHILSKMSHEGVRASTTAACVSSRMNGKTWVQPMKRGFCFWAHVLICGSFRNPPLYVLQHLAPL